MLSRNQIFLPAIFLLLAGFFFLSTPQTSYAQPLSDCCFSNGSPGCDDQACETAVCATDPFCCNITWDTICAGIAETECGALCTNIPVVRDIPTMSEWGLIAFAGILGLIGFFYIFTRRKQATS